MSFKAAANEIRQLLPELKWKNRHPRPLLTYNPNQLVLRDEHVTPIYSLFRYSTHQLEEKKLSGKEVCEIHILPGQTVWINIDGLRKADVERICNCYDIHPLMVEDILSIGQRAKMDEMDNVLFCLLPMLYYNDTRCQIETEQVSLVLGKNFVLSFQEDPVRDVFDPVRERLRIPASKVRQRSADYLCYALLDIIIDSYFGVIEQINDRIETLEDQLLLQRRKKALSDISLLRREVMLLRRSILPVRDLVHGFLRSESELLEERNEKYFKDVLDHITQANDYVENEREMLMNLQDLAISQINLRMNEVMKLFTVIATLLAPATVISGIFGMNFDVIPLAHQKDGFYLSVGIMVLFPVLMIIWFRRKGWF